MLDAVMDMKTELYLNESWTINVLMVEVAQSYSSHETVEINVIDTFGKVERVTKNKLNIIPKYWLPKSLNKNDRSFRSKVVVSHLNKGCIPQGFTLRIRNYYEKQNRLHAVGTEMDIQMDDGICNSSIAQSNDN